jgi:hypothetical protein
MMMMMRRRRRRRGGGRVGMRLELERTADTVSFWSFFLICPYLIHDTLPKMFQATSLY